MFFFLHDLALFGNASSKWLNGLKLCLFTVRFLFLLLIFLFRGLSCWEVQYDLKFPHLEKWFETCLHCFHCQNLIFQSIQSALKAPKFDYVFRSTMYGSNHCKYGHISDKSFFISVTSLWPASDTLALPSFFFSCSSCFWNMFEHDLWSEQSFLMVGGDKATCIPGHTWCLPWRVLSMCKLGCT